MIKGKIAVITGGSRGIGAAAAKKLASMGADIAIIYAGNKEMADSVCSDIANEFGVRARSYRCDVSDFNEAGETVKKIKEELGGIDILINNAGITRDGLLMRMSEEDFDRVLDTNLKGAFNMLRHVSPIFIRSRYGRVVNISSVVGLHGNAGQCNYAASKAGIIGLTKAAAKELAGKNILCNAVAPGFILTDMTKELGSTEQWLSSIPLKRVGSPEDVAGAIAFLADTDYITGQVIGVDGGMGM